VLPHAEGVSQQVRAGEREQPLRYRDWGEDDDSSPPRHLHIRRRSRGIYRFLNATTIGALLGFLIPASILSLTVLSTTGLKIDVLGRLAAGSVCLGVVGAAVGIVGGWLLDTLIHVVRKATRDETTERPDRRGRTPRLRRQEDEE
jgi:hypothetical protein